MKILRRIIKIVILLGIIALISYGGYKVLNNYGERISGYGEKIINKINIFDLNRTYFTQVSAGTFFSLALTNDGRLWVAGRNFEGQLGTGDREDVTKWTYILNDIQSISAGHTHALALTKDGRVLVAGSNYYGELGVGRVKQIIYWTPVLSNIKSIAAGQFHSLALGKDGRVWATGLNYYGQLGTEQYFVATENIKNNVRHIQKPRRSIRKWIPVLSDVEAVYAGMDYSLALKKDGTLWAAGRNAFGQFGNGSNRDSREWILVANEVKNLQHGFSNTDLVIKISQKELLTRKNYEAELAEIKQGEQAVAPTTNAKNSSRPPIWIPCSEGDVWATGWNWDFQMSYFVEKNEYEEEAEAIPEAEWERKNNYEWRFVTGNIVKISTGPNHVFILKKDNDLWAAGSNGRGQLGLEKPIGDQRKWAFVLDNVLDMSGGFFHSLAIKNDGTLWVAGDNFHNQLGIENKKEARTWQKITKLNKNRRIPQNNILDETIEDEEHGEEEFTEPPVSIETEPQIDQNPSAAPAPSAAPEEQPPKEEAAGEAQETQDNQEPQE